MKTDDRQKISAHYAGGVRTYADFWAPALLHCAAPLIESVPETGLGLDLGCGAGVITRAVLDHRTSVRMIGADLVMEMMRNARAVLPGVDLVRIDAPRLPFRDRAFDFVVSTFVLQHVREQRRAMSEAFRVLKPGGLFLSASWGRNDPGCGAYDVWEEALKEFGAPAEDPDPVSRWDESIHTEPALRSLVSSAGFDVTSLTLETPSYAWTAETLEAVRLNLGAPARRFRAIPAARREVFVREARRRLRSLEADDFVWEPEVLLAAARRGEDRTGAADSVD